MRPSSFDGTSATLLMPPSARRPHGREPGCVGRSVQSRGTCRATIDIDQLGGSSVCAQILSSPGLDTRNCSRGTTATVTRVSVTLPSNADWCSSDIHLARTKGQNAGPRVAKPIGREIRWIHSASPTGRQDCTVLRHTAVERIPACDSLQPIRYCDSLNINPFAERHVTVERTRSLWIPPRLR